jgi:scyllo-inositol 2-dehydrogenase (NADP+)
LIHVVIVGHGLAGRWFHAPLVRRQAVMHVHGVVARDPEIRAEAVALYQCTGYASLDEALADPGVDLVILATPHSVHAEQAVSALQAGKHCVVDKVMALSEAEADRMIAARDASGRMLSVFHNRRWDWDYQTLRSLKFRAAFGRPVLIESAVCQHKPPRDWRARAAEAGTILHDWGAHLIDQALQLGLGPCRRITAWLAPAPWEGVDVGGHGRIVLEFDRNVLFQVETSRICLTPRPRFWVVGTNGGYVKFGLDPQEDALRKGDLDLATECDTLWGQLTATSDSGSIESTIEPIRVSWDSYYANIGDHLLNQAPLAVTAEQAREVVRVLDAAQESITEHRTIEGRWGD